MHARKFDVLTSGEFNSNSGNKQNFFKENLNAKKRLLSAFMQLRASNFFVLILND